MEKIIEIAFANNKDINLQIKKDLEEAIEHASYNLLSRFHIKFTKIKFYKNNFVIYLSIPNLNNQNINRKLRGISDFLLQKSNNKKFYQNLLVGKRLLCYRDITYINKQNDEEKEIIDNLKILKQTISLIESDKECDKEKLRKINDILNNSNNNNNNNNL